MARPYKQGIDYFPLDVDIFKDRKFHKIKGRYGHTGVCVYLAILSLVYKDRGYYLDYSDEEAVIYDIIDLLQGGRYTPKYDTIRSAVADLVACGLFSGDHFKSKILTSERIQRHYYTATVEREKIEIDESIWMLSISEMKKLSGRSPILQFFINREENRVIRTKNSENQPNSTQSKVKESNITTTDAPCGAYHLSNVEKDTGNVESESITYDIPSFSTVEAFFKEHNVNGNPKDFYAYNQRKNPMFKDWEAYAEIWGSLEKKRTPESYTPKRKKQQLGWHSNPEECSFDLERFFEAACLKAEEDFTELDVQ